MLRGTPPRPSSEHFMSRVVGGADGDQHVGRSRQALIDNRIVISNQLRADAAARSRSRIYRLRALVQAVKKFPNMNRHYTEVGGKPPAVSAHANLDLASTCKGKDGKRSLVVARHQAVRICDSHGSSRPTRHRTPGPRRHKS